MAVTGSTTASTSVQVGRFCVCLPLRVHLRDTPEGNWIALLEPPGMTELEWGYGSTPQHALDDLGSTLEEIMGFVFARPDQALGSALGRYKRALAKYVSVNTTLSEQER